MGELIAFGIAIGIIAGGIFMYFYMRVTEKYRIINRKKEKKRYFHLSDDPQVNENIDNNIITELEQLVEDGEIVVADLEYIDHMTSRFYGEKNSLLITLKSYNYDDFEDYIYALRLEQSKPRGIFGVGKTYKEKYVHYAIGSILGCLLMLRRQINCIDQELYDRHAWKQFVKQ